MDYRYIEQLLERYFAAETTVQEERILQAFFEQEEGVLPDSLRPYRPLFACKGSIMADEQLGDDFDARILAMVDEAQPVVVKARTIKLSDRLMPLFRAAAIVAIILTLGNAMRISLTPSDQAGDDINYADYKDTYDDPAVAYDKVENALELLSDGYMQAQQTDSLIKE